MSSHEVPRDLREHWKLRTDPLVKSNTPFTNRTYCFKCRPLTHRRHTHTNFDCSCLPIKLTVSPWQRLTHPASTRKRTTRTTSIRMMVSSTATIFLFLRSLRSSGVWLWSLCLQIFKRRKIYGGGHAVNS